MNSITAKKTWVVPKKIKIVNKSNVVESTCGLKPSAEGQNSTKTLGLIGPFTYFESEKAVKILLCQFGLLMG